LIFSSFTFLILFSCFYCYKNTLAQINMQDLTYNASSFGIKIKYPADWKANYSQSDPKADETTIVTISPKTNSNVTEGAVNVWVDNNPPTYDLVNYLQNELESSKKNIANYSFSGLSIKSTTLSGNPALSYSYKSKINGKEVNNFVVVTLINGKAYKITYFAQTEKFPVNIFSVDKIINSFVVVPYLLSSPAGVVGGRGPSSSNASIGTSVTNNSQISNNINIVNQLNSNKDNPSRVSDGSNAGSDTINNTTITNTTANPQSTGIAAQQANASSKMGLPNNQNITLPPPNLPVSTNNKPPIANADTSSQTVTERYIVLLNGSKSYDPDGDPITFSWRQIGGPAVKLDDTTISMPSFTAPNVSIDGKILFELTVKDDKGAKSSSLITVIDKHNVGIATSSNLSQSSQSQNNSSLINENSMNMTNSSTSATLESSFPQSNSSTPLDNLINGLKNLSSGANKALNTNSVPLNTSIDYPFLKQWGSFGTGDGQFNFPRGITVDSAGNVYVADTHNSRIQKFDSSGTFLAKWGSEGTGNGQFDYPNDIAVDSAGNVYVADTINDRIQKFDSSGTFLTKWGINGTGNGQFENPDSIAVDSAGNVYVADTINDRIQKFDSSGTFLAKWGSDNEQLVFPESIAVDSAGNVYTVDLKNQRIQKFDSSGTFLTKWNITDTDTSQFDNPGSIAVDSAGNVYVTDTGNQRIQKFDSSGTFLAMWGSSGTGDGQFQDPSGIDVGTYGNVYVTDGDNNRIQVFSSSATVMIPSNASMPLSEQTGGGGNMTGMNMTNISGGNMTMASSNASMPLSYNEQTGVGGNMTMMMGEKLLNYTNNAIIAFEDKKKSATFDNLQIMQQDLINANNAAGTSNQNNKLNIAKLLDNTNSAIKGLIDNKKSVVINNLKMLQEDLIIASGKQPIVIPDSNN
jgi:streptogramin lyase